MPNNLKHFAIHADDVERARASFTSKRLVGNLPRGDHLASFSLRRELMLNLAFKARCRDAARLSPANQCLDSNVRWEWIQSTQQSKPLKRVVARL
jgi:hypothetical protein